MLLAGWRSLEARQEIIRRQWCNGTLAHVQIDKTREGKYGVGW